MTTIAIQLVLPLVAFLAAIVYSELRHSPRIAQLEQQVEAIFVRDTTPAERASLAAFIKQETPAVKAALPILEGAALQSHMVGRATQFAQQHGLSLTPQQIVATVQQGIAEGLPAAAKAAGAAVGIAAAGAVAAGVADVTHGAAPATVATPQPGAKPPA